MGLSLPPAAGREPELCSSFSGAAKPGCGAVMLSGMQGDRGDTVVALGVSASPAFSSTICDAADSEGRCGDRYQRPAKLSHLRGGFPVKSRGRGFICLSSLPWAVPSLSWLQLVCVVSWPS